MARWVTNGLTALLSLVLWRVFFPAILSTDSLTQYRQAVENRYDDWHPPLMALVLHAVLALGGSIGFVTLTQVVFGMFGIRALSEAALRLTVRDRLDDNARRGISAAVLVLLLLPISPLAFHLMTFWKDTWALVMLLWLLAGLLRIATGSFSKARVVSTIALATGLAMVRHNGVFTLPFVALALSLASPSLSRRRRWLLAIAPILAFATLKPLVDGVFRVRPRHLETVVQELDLLGLCAQGREVCSQLPWIDAHIPEKAALARYRPGDVGFFLWDRDHPAPVDPNIREDYARMRAEYLTALERLPLALVRVKIEAFTQLLGCQETFAFFFAAINPNQYGLAFDPRFAGVRAWLVEWTQLVAATGWRWIFGVHLVWLLINGCWVAAAVVRWRRSGERAWLLLGGVTLVPLSYYASYLLATTAHDFRFMYPSALTVQVMSLSALLGSIYARARLGGEGAAQVRANIGSAHCRLASALFLVDRIRKPVDRLGITRREDRLAV